jgi:hypothetical protein
MSTEFACNAMKSWQQKIELHFSYLDVNAQNEKHVFDFSNLPVTFLSSRRL